MLEPGGAEFKRSPEKQGSWSEPGKGGHPGSGSEQANPSCRSTVPKKRKPAPAEAKIAPSTHARAGHGKSETGAADEPPFAAGGPRPRSAPRLAARSPRSSVGCGVLCGGERVTIQAKPAAQSTAVDLRK